MISVISSTITGTVLTVLLMGVLLFAMLDPVLPIYWKIIVSIVTVILIYGSIFTLRDTLFRLKATYSNKEDLR